MADTPDTRRNRPDSKLSTNNWLTPKEIVDVLGPFDTDPACHDPMPWATAVRMIYPTENGLLAEWFGRVFLNPPWSTPLSWACRMADHKNGIWLSSSKSCDTRWAQVILSTCDAVLFPAGRPLFCFPDGTPSLGKWTPIMIAAWGDVNITALQRLRDSIMPGVLMSRLA